jgi:uncharacterized membrane protein
MWKIIVGIILICIGSVELFFINEEEKAAAWNYHNRKEQLVFVILILTGMFLIYTYWRNKISKKIK